MRSRCVVASAAICGCGGTVPVPSLASVPIWTLNPVLCRCRMNFSPAGGLSGVELFRGRPAVPASTVLQPLGGSSGVGPFRGRPAVPVPIVPQLSTTPAAAAIAPTPMEQARLGGSAEFGDPRSESEEDIQSVRSHRSANGRRSGYRTDRMGRDFSSDRDDTAPRPLAQQQQRFCGLGRSPTDTEVSNLVRLAQMLKEDIAEFIEALRDKVAAGKIREAAQELYDEAGQCLWQLFKVPGLDLTSISAPLRQARRAFRKILAESDNKVFMGKLAPVSPRFQASAPSHLLPANQPTGKPTNAHECSALPQDEVLPTNGGCAVNTPSIASDGGCGDGPHLAGPVAFGCWPAVVETPESKATSALSSFSFKPSVPCSGAPMDPQLQVGGGGQMSALSWPSNTAGSEIGQHSKGEDTQSASNQSSPSWCHSNQTDCDTGSDTDDSDAEQAMRLRRR